MRVYFLLILVLIGALGGLSACGAGEALPPLAVTDEVTLIFIYTNP